MKKLLFAFLLLLAPSFALAQVTTHGGGTGLVDISTGSIPFGSIFNIRMATSTALQFNNTFARLTVTNASTSNVSVSSLTPGNCVQASTGGLLTTVGSACGSGGGSSTFGTSSLSSLFPIIYTQSASLAQFSFGGLTTSTPAVIGNIPYFSGVNTFANVATGTVSAGVGVSVTAGQSIIGSGLTITNTGVTSLTANSPLTRDTATGAVTISCASCATFAFPFTAATTYNTITQSTTTPIWFQGTPFSFFASSTAVFSNASTTQLTVNDGTWFTGVTASRPLYVDSTGMLGSAGSGVSGNCVNWGANNTLGDAGSACGSGGGGASFGKTWELSNNFFNVSSLAPTTTVPISVYSTATSTFAGGAIFATSTGAMIGIGSTTPFAELSVHAQAGSTFTNNTLFAIGSSTANSTSTLFKVDNIGGFIIGTSTPAGLGNGFAVLNNAATAGNGLVLTTSPGGSGLNLVATSSTANEALTILSKGTAAATFGSTASGVINLTNGATILETLSASGVTFQNIIAFAFNGIANTVAATVRFSAKNQAADVGLTASTEATWAYFNIAQTTRTHSNSAILLQRDFRVTGTPHAFTSFASSNNIGTAVAFAVDGPPVMATNANGTTTNAYGIFVGSTTPLSAQPALNASTTNAFGFGIMTPSGATNNYAASSTGKWIMNGLTSTTAGTNQDVCLVAATGELVTDTTGTCIVSSKRFKHDIATLTTPALAAVTQLRPVTFTPNDDDVSDYQNSDVGLIAEEVAAVDPHFAKYGTDGLPRTLDDRALLAVTIKAVQELSQKGVTTVTTSAEDNWQDILIALLILGFFYQQYQIKKLKKTI